MRFWILDLGLRIYFNPQSQIRIPQSSHGDAIVRESHPAYPFPAVPRKNGPSNAFIIKRPSFIVRPNAIEVKEPPQALLDFGARDGGTVWLKYNRQILYSTIDVLLTNALTRSTFPLLYGS